MSSECTWPPRDTSDDFCAFIPHFFEPGLLRGILHPAATLTDREAIALRVDRMAGVTLVTLAERYSTSVATAWRVVHFQGRWAE